MSEPQAGLDPERRARLRQAKLAALVASGWEPTGLVDTAAAGGPAPGLVDAEGRGWVLAHPRSAGALGGALIWALRHDVGGLHVLVDGAVAPGPGDPSPAVLSRRGSLFRVPDTAVWEVHGRDLRQAAPAPPAGPGAGYSPALAESEAMADLLRAHGVDPIVEDGVLVGEVLGLEVARAVAGEGGASLEVGVGLHDRQARSAMRPGQSVGEALEEVVAVVRQWRSPTARRHPANMLARERWLRSLVMGRPALVGARYLDPVAGLLPRTDLRRAVPAVAVGVGDDDRAVVVACSTGVDLDLVPVAADHRHAYGADSRLVLVVPEGDDVRATRDLTEALAEPAELITVPRDWAAALTG